MHIGKIVSLKIRRIWTNFGVIGAAVAKPYIGWGDGEHREKFGKIRQKRTSFGSYSYLIANFL